MWKHNVLLESFLVSYSSLTYLSRDIVSPYSSSIASGLPTQKQETLLMLWIALLVVLLCFNAPLVGQRIHLCSSPPSTSQLSLSPWFMGYLFLSVSSHASLYTQGFECSIRSAIDQLLAQMNGTSVRLVARSHSCCTRLHYPSGMCLLKQSQAGQ